MKTEAQSFYQQVVQQTIEHIAGNLDEALDLPSLAAMAALSPFHFHRVFAGMVGETPLGLARRLRMERAAWTLAHTQRPITEIAFEAGYETHEAFTRAFRACYADSPSGFRQRKYPHIQLAAACGIHFDPEGRLPRFLPHHSGGQAMEVEIKEMPEFRVGAIRHVGPYNQIPKAFERLGAIAGPHGLFQHPGAACLGLFYDDPETTPPDQLRSDAAIIVPEGAPLPEGLVEQRIAGGRYACTVHVGPYEELGDVWARFLGEWLPASGYRIGEGAGYELYRSDPTTTPREALRTELYIPIN